MSANEIELQRAKLPSQLATINALLNRDPAAAIAPPTAIPPIPAIAPTDDELLHRAAQQNRELQAQRHDIAAKHDAIARAKAEYLPDVGINASTDLAGVTQSLMASVMLPFLRYQAIDAGIRQAEANLHAAEATRRQAGNDLASRIVADAAMLRDLDRQVALYQNTLLPRAHAVINASQTTFSIGRSPVVSP
jgi:outer membrane protein TolC